VVGVQEIVDNIQFIFSLKTAVEKIESIKEALFVEVHLKDKCTEAINLINKVLKECNVDPKKDLKPKQEIQVRKIKPKILRYRR